MYKNGIYGAIIGDICGSKMEVDEIRNRKNPPNLPARRVVLNKDYQLFQDDMFYTDDTILTTALCEALLNDKDFEKYIRQYGVKEISSLKPGDRNKFGQKFTEWCKGADFRESFGNGCGMRISPIAFYAQSLSELEHNVVKATVCTHNHPESIKCAMAVAKAIYHAKNGAGKTEIEAVAERALGQKLNFDLKDLQDNYTFTARAMDSIPQAIFCFLKSNSFEEAIINSLSIGGDTDTNAAIAGSLAGSFYGISDELVQKAKSYLSKDYAVVLDSANALFNEINNSNELE